MSLKPATRVAHGGKASINAGPLPADCTSVSDLNYAGARCRPGQSTGVSGSPEAADTLQN